LFILCLVKYFCSGYSLKAVNLSCNISNDSKGLEKNKKYEDLLSLISKAYGYSYEAYFLKSDIVTKLFEYCQTSLADEESFTKFKKRRGLCVNGGNFDNIAHYLSCNFWHIFNTRLNKREII
jgi:hypothetical protein